MIHYLTPADVYAINETVLGHQPMVRDRRLLVSAMQRPMNGAFGQEAYPTLMEKAAAIMHSLAAHHLFHDGNKRTATLATIRFLNLNGLAPSWREDDAYDFVLEIAKGQRDVPEIADWLERHTSQSPGDNPS